MRACNECGSDVAENDIFCPYCGLGLQQAEAAVSLSEPAEQEAVVEDEFDSTIMMSPEEASALANEARENVPEPEVMGGLEEQNDPETHSDPIEDPEPVMVPSEALPTAIENPNDLGTRIDPPRSEPSLNDEIPEPNLLREERETSGNVNIPKTAEHIAYSSVEMDELPKDAESDEDAAVGDTPLDMDATIVGGPPIPSEEGSKEAVIESRGSVSDEAAQSASEPVGIDSSSAPAEIETSSEGIPDHQPPKPEPEDKMISMPAVDLDLPDPFPGNSMFDSVRIIEGPLPEINADADASIKSAISSGRSAEGEPVLSEDQGQSTAAGLGASDTDGRRSAKLKPLSEGTILNGRYEIVRKIGGGGMGAVYLASDNNLGGVLRAVKEMVQSHIEDDQQEKAIADFKRESTILTSLDHPSIPTIYDYFYDESEGRFYLVMKYISGGDLSSRLRSASDGRIDEKTVVEWGIQITEVLDYLHSQPSTIVYRDLKPSNIMVDGNTDRIMLIDFGIARSISQKEEKGVTAVGTMGYAPPELFSGNVEPRSDIYSLGSTMFHLMTGADPQSNPLLIFDFQKNPRPRQINPRLSDQIESILMRCVEYSSEARYPSAGELRDELRKHLNDLGQGKVTFGAGTAPVSVGLSSQQVFCGFCGQRIVATDLFCAFCGAKQPMAQQGVQSQIYSSSTKTARLVIEGTTELTAPSYMLQKDENLVGRRDPMSNIFPEVDLSKYDPQTKISRRHARIWRDGANFHLEDLGSSNGTTLTQHLGDSLKLTPHRPHALTNGDKIKIGDTILHFVVN